MTVIELTTIHPNPGVKREDVQKQLKKACELARNHGAENVTVLRTIFGRPPTNAIGVLSSVEDWAHYRKLQHALLNDPKMQAILQEAGQIATWESRVSQTIPEFNEAPQSAGAGTPVAS